MPPAEPPVYKLVGDGRPWSSLDASMKQFYINEQQRMEMEHGQSAPLASAPTHLRFLRCMSWLWSARHSQGAAQSLGAHLLPLGLEKRKQKMTPEPPCLPSQEIEHARMLKQIAEAVRPRHSNPGHGQRH